MALLPFIVYNLEDLVQPPQLDQALDLELPRMKILSFPRETVDTGLRMAPRQNHTLNELKNMLDLATRRCEKSRAPPINKDDFQAVLDVQHFKPEEIEVKVVDNFLVVTAKHEDRRDDHGWVSRQFVRRYQLPEDVSIEDLTSRLSSDGLLTIVAPKKQPHKDETVRTLKIECTGKPFQGKKKEKQTESKTSEQSDEKKPESEVDSSK